MSNYAELNSLRQIKTPSGFPCFLEWSKERARWVIVTRHGNTLGIPGAGMEWLEQGMPLAAMASAELWMEGYEAGYEAGMSYGKQDLAKEIKRLLGL